MPQLATRGEKIPVTVITGFLGSGKSTLLNHLLTEKGDKNICVIENEFGEVNIDKTLVGDKLEEREDLVSIENGCVCCSLRKDIARAFQELEKRSKERKRPMDHILLETTGLADPSPVAFTFFANPWIAARFRLDSITCVVDAKYLMQHLEDTRTEGVNEAVQQLAFADCILLNKVDLVDEAGKKDVTAAIRKINNTARIIECQLNAETGRPAIDDILGTNTFSVQRCLEVDPQFLDSDSDCDTQQLQQQPCETGRGEEGTSQGEHACAHDTLEEAKAEVSGQKRDRTETEPCSCHPDQVLEKKPKRRRKKLHDLSDVSSVGITARGALDEYRFNMFMRDLLTEKAKDIFRCKGVLSVHGYGDKKFVFQGVHETICYGPADKPWEEGEPRLNQIVFIGRKLERKMLIEGFRTCIWIPLPEGWEEAVDEASKKHYYFNRKTGEKSWQRPDEVACAHVTSHHATTEQPRGVRPSARRTASQSLLQVGSAGAADQGNATGNAGPAQVAVA